MTLAVSDIVSDIREGMIPAAIYSDEEVFRLEQERVFGRAWMFMAHESEIPDPGDYVVRVRLLGPDGPHVGPGLGDDEGGDNGGNVNPTTPGVTPGTQGGTGDDSQGGDNGADKKKPRANDDANFDPNAYETPPQANPGGGTQAPDNG